MISSVHLADLVYLIDGVHPIHLAYSLYLGKSAAHTRAPWARHHGHHLAFRIRHHEHHADMVSHLQGCHELRDVVLTFPHTPSGNFRAEVC